MSAFETPRTLTTAFRAQGQWAPGGGTPREGTLSQASARDWTTKVWPFSLYCEWERRMEGEFEGEELTNLCPLTIHNASGVTTVGSPPSVLL